MEFPAKGGDRFRALDTISIDVAEHEFVCLIGHSGCGKSTLLNLIAGLVTPTAGVIACDGKIVRGPGPDRAVVFQSHALLPWMTCYENVHLAANQVFGRTLSAPEVRQKAERALALVHLEHAMQKYPFEISGGMKQRVGLARALAVAPRILLLDEPFGALDALTRASLQDELVRLVDSIRSTVVMVTHDVDEAILLSDRIMMMTNGPAARIGDTLKIELPRPRDRLALAAHPEYAAYREYVLRFLYQRQKPKADDGAG
jgi:nitrate/nitrite transport system ATP-binding protein